MFLHTTLTFVFIFSPLKTNPIVAKLKQSQYFFPKPLPNYSIRSLHFSSGHCFMLVRALSFQIHSIKTCWEPQHCAHLSTIFFTILLLFSLAGLSDLPSPPSFHLQLLLNFLDEVEHTVSPSPIAGQSAARAMVPGKKEKKIICSVE